MASTGVGTQGAFYRRKTTPYMCYATLWSDFLSFWFIAASMPFIITPMNPPPSSILPQPSGVGFGKMQLFETLGSLMFPRPTFPTKHGSCDQWLWSYCPIITKKWGGHGIDNELINTPHIVDRKDAHTSVTYPPGPTLSVNVVYIWLN